MENGQLVFDVFVDGAEFGVRLVVDLKNIPLEGLDDTLPLRVRLRILVAVDEDGTIVGVNLFLLKTVDFVDEAEESVTLPVQLLLLGIFVDDFGVHDICVLFRDQSNDKV